MSSYMYVIVQEFKSFWPNKDEPTDIGCFKLTYREDDERKKYNIKEFLLQSTQVGIRSYKTVLTFDNPEKKPFENIGGKAENGASQHSLLFPQCFPSWQRKKSTL